MTWGEFKAWVAAQPMRDSDEIGYVDFSVAPHDVDIREDWPTPGRTTVDIS